MALIDVVKWEANSNELVHKFPSNDLRIGTQLVVYNGQIAYFVKGGKVLDSFESGTHTLKSENIPLLNKLVNLPFGGNSPFQAEVWFVNKLAVMDTKWGTPVPIQLEDPKYGIIVPVRSFGQYGLRVADPRVFLDNLVGNMASFSVDKINSYFKGKMMSFFANLISDKLTKDNISVLNINSYLIELSQYVEQSLAEEFTKYGLTFENFHIMSINVPEDDPSFKKLKEAKELQAQLNINGREIYQMNRSFDVMDKAAANEGGGNFVGMGMGLGAGANLGNQLGVMMGGQPFGQLSATPPPIPQPIQFYVAVKGQQQGPFDISVLSSYIANGQITRDTLVWKQGMPSWTQASAVPELSQFFGTCPPPIPTL